MIPTLAKNTLIYFLAEAPGAHEDEQSHRPLTGPSGTLLRECIPDDEEQYCSFDNVVNCFPGDTVISSPSTTHRMYRRWYDGSLVVIKTARGHKLSGTPNHPVMTPTGWVSLKLLKQGGELFTHTNVNGVTRSDPNIEDAPITFEQVFNSLSDCPISDGIVGTRMDFHGDGANSEIKIFETTRSLLLKGNALFNKQLRQEFLVRTNKVIAGGEKLSSANFHCSNVLVGGGPVSFDPNVEAPFESVGRSCFHPRVASFTHTSNCYPLETKVAYNRDRLDFVDSSKFFTANSRSVFVDDICISEDISPRTSYTNRLFMTTKLDVLPDQEIFDTTPANIEPSSKFGPTSPSLIEIDYVVSIEIIRFAGHVYNLETEDGWYVANNVCVSNCRPPKNRTPVWQEVEACRPRRIKWIEESKPKLIVGLGIVPMHAILGSTDMAGMRGRLFAVKIGNHECWYMPTYHPSFILRVAYDKKKPLNSKMGHCLRMDIKRAFALIGKLKKPHIDTPAEVRANIECFPGPSDFDRLLGLLKAADAAPLKSIDLETKGLRPFTPGGAIMTAAVSHGKVNFSFAIDHPKAGWTPEQRAQILGAFERLLRNKTTAKIAHNLPFEMEWLIWTFGKDIADHKSWDCTQMQAHFLDERRGSQSRGGDDDSRRATYQRLDFLCKQYFGVAYKSLFKLDKKDMSKSDLGETLIYNAVDTKYSLRLFLKQKADLEDQGLSDAYEDALPRQISTALMQNLGIDVDQTTVVQFKVKLTKEIEAIHKQIDQLKVVKAFIKDHGRFDALSPDQAAKLFYTYLNYKEVKIDDKFSVDKGVLEHIDHPLAALIMELRNKNKLKSTYVDILELGPGEQIFPDGLIHCNFNTTFTETGRTSSDEPNMQNFPSRNDAWIRKQVVAGPGHVLIAFDYGQLEACTAAMCSKDKVLVKALWEDYDIHMEWATRLHKRYPLILGTSQSFTDPVVAKKLRSLVKNKLTFPAIFGAQNKSIAGYLSCPEDVIDDLMDDFWKQFSGLKNWQDKLMKKYYDEGVVYSYVGRARRYPLTRNQAINHPVQCLAAEIVCNAMNRMSAMAVQTGDWILHPRLNVHDDLTFIVPDNDIEIERAIKTIYKVMLTPPYKCVNVPLSVSVSVGANWYGFNKKDPKENPDGMQEIGKFWSHRDL